MSALKAIKFIRENNAMGCSLRKVVLGSLLLLLASTAGAGENAGGRYFESVFGEELSG